MSDTDLMPFGMHKGEMMEDVPASWLMWLRDNGSETVRNMYAEVFNYIEENMDVIQKELREQK